MFHPQSARSTSVTRTGESINDHPSTWNQDSDQLADELAALALNMDPELSPATRDESSLSKGSIDANEPKNDEEYVYETYVRMPQAEYPVSGDVEAGIIVVEDDDQDFWETFADETDDKTWDEEDADSNGKSLRFGKFSLY